MNSNSRVTLDTYARAETPAKRLAQSKVVAMILPRKKERLRLREPEKLLSFLFSRVVLAY
jgi:hypothetical protein